MATGKDHLNKALVSITDGKKLGEIKDLYVDAGLNKVTAVFLGKEGLIKRKSLAIARADIQVLGVDVWLVAGPDKVVDAAEMPDSGQFVLVGDLRGRAVQTEGGTLIGVVDDVILDGEANVLGFALGKVHVKGPLAERKAIARGAVTSLGGKDSPMMAVMAQAETMPVPGA